MPPLESKRPTIQADGRFSTTLSQFPGAVRSALGFSGGGSF